MSRTCWGDSILLRPTAFPSLGSVFVRDSEILLRVRCSNTNKYCEEGKEIRNPSAYSATEFQVCPKLITIVVIYVIIFMGFDTVERGKDVGQYKRATRHNLGG